MMNNNLLELSGRVDLIATAICDFDTPTKHYKKGEIVLNLEDVLSEIVMQDKGSQSTSRKLDLDYSTLLTKNIQLNYVPLDSQLSNLISLHEESFAITKCKNLLCREEGVAILFDYVEDTQSVIIPSLREYSISNNEQTKTSFVFSKELMPDNYYFVQYDVQVTKNPIILDTFDINIPYLRLQLCVNGNLNKEDSESYILIDKAKLHFIPILQLDSSGVTYCSLRFNVIDSNKPPMLVM